MSVHRVYCRMSSVSSCLLSAQPALAQDANYSLQQMKLGPKSSYLCLIPPPPRETPLVEEAPTEVATPVHSWALLQPLSGTCLYVSLGYKSMHSLRRLPGYSTAKGGSHTRTAIIPMSVSFTSCTTSKSPAQVTHTSLAVPSRLLIGNVADNRRIQARRGSGGTCTPRDSLPMHRSLN